MKLVLLGQFETDGNIVVTDPCYELAQKYNKKLKVEKGLYDVYVIRGKMKDPIFEWDSVPGNLRNAQLIIIKNNYKGKLDFKRLSSKISVNSGQAGFFNIKSYGKKSDEPLKLVNHPYHFFREKITSKILEMRRNRLMIKEKDSNILYRNLLKNVFKDSHHNLKEHYTRQSKFDLQNIKDSKKFLKTKEYPSYIEVKSSNEFYEIMCNLTKGEHESGIYEYGAVSMSGEGDGSYDVFVARNLNKKIVAAYLDFMSLKDLVK